ncbi:hypothetical protein JTB14_030079 [Gonioctena quinquepunctata]|nr:hypothetical protein JTB14_030079 [Gonioctena quinquepunctata]
MLNLDINEPTRVTPTSNTNLDYPSETSDLRKSDRNAQILSLKLDSQKPKKSTGFDDIPITIIKDNINVLKSPLTHLFNLTFTEGNFQQH